MNSLEKRVEKLEKQVQWYRSIAVVVVLIFCAGTLMAARRTPKVLRCQKLQVVNSRGEIRAELEIQNDGAILNMADDQGVPRVILGIKEGKSGLFLTDAAWNTRINLIVDKDIPLLTLNDSVGEFRMVLTVDKNNTPIIELFDAQGNPRATLDVDELGPSLSLAGPKGKSVAYLTVTKDGSDLTLSDSERNPRIALTAYKDGPSLILLDALGRQRAILGENSMNAGLTLHDSKGTPRAAMLLFKHGGPKLALFDAQGKRIFKEP